MDRSIRVPCVLMRGGTSRGPFFLLDDLPLDRDLRDRVLLSALGSGHELQVDGIGGGNPLTSKVAMVGPSSRPDADVDYLFAQVNVLQQLVDTSPNCGNMLSAVAPFAIEKGIVRASDPTTRVRIHNVNTGKLIDAVVRTPGRRVEYEGDVHIDGVPGTAAPIYLSFIDSAGSKTGRLFPTGNMRDRIGGIEVTCIDAAMPLVIMNARNFGMTGREAPAAFDAATDVLARLEAVRREAGRLMGLGDVSNLVIPKPVLVEAPARGGSITARYFMPHSCHKAFAVTGAVGLATACAMAGTIAAPDGMIDPMPTRLTIEHPSGRLDMRLDRRGHEDAPVVSVVRTARRIFDGFVHVKNPEVTTCAA